MIKILISAGLGSQDLLHDARPGRERALGRERGAGALQVLRIIFFLRCGEKVSTAESAIIRQCCSIDFFGKYRLYSLNMCSPI